VSFQENKVFVGTAALAVSIGNWVPCKRGFGSAEHSRGIILSSRV